MPGGPRRHWTPSQVPNGVGPPRSAGPVPLSRHMSPRAPWRSRQSSPLLGHNLCPTTQTPQPLEKLVPFSTSKYQLLQHARELLPCCRDLPCRDHNGLDKPKNIHTAQTKTVLLPLCILRRSGDKLGDQQPINCCWMRSWRCKQKLPHVRVACRWTLAAWGWAMAAPTWSTASCCASARSAAGTLWTTQPNDLSQTNTLGFHHLGIKPLILAQSILLRLCLLSSHNPMGHRI